MIKKTTLKTNLGSYIVVENDNFENPDFRFGSIDTKYVKDGKLTKRLNGFEMALAPTLAEAIDKRIEIDYLAELALKYGDNEEIYNKKLIEYYKNKMVRA